MTPLLSKFNASAVLAILKRLENLHVVRSVAVAGHGEVRIYSQYTFMHRVWIYLTLICPDVFLNLKLYRPCMLWATGKD